jgi:hypothetical protein
VTRYENEAHVGADVHMATAVGDGGAVERVAGVSLRADDAEASVVVELDDHTGERSRRRRQLVSDVGVGRLH